MIDITGFHALLHLRAGEGGEIQVHQRRYAEELSVHKLVVHRVLQRMISEGRLELISGSGPTSRTYRVIPPREWEAARSAPTDPTCGGAPTPSSTVH